MVSFTPFILNRQNFLWHENCHGRWRIDRYSAIFAESKNCFLEAKKTDLVEYSKESQQAIC